MKSCYTIISIIFILLPLLIIAQEDPFSELTYPIPELGNCQSKEDCEVFCEQAENATACLDYAQAHNLLPEEEIEIARKMLEAGETAGPGGCQGMVECEAYCDDISHLEECIIFAEEHGLIPPDELEEARKVIKAIKQGIKPPPCRGQTECDIYCSQPEHMEECIAFAQAAGLMPADEMEEAKKVLGAIKKGVNPPPCRSEQECDIYCSEPEHFEECLLFAEAAGFIPPEELEEAKMMLNALRQGVKPPPCRSEEECDVYCQGPEHMEECINFAEAAGFMTPEEAAQARKMAEMGITGGPGGCRSEEECEAFCQDPANMEECLEFAVKMGEMTSEEAAQARQGMRGMQAGPGGCMSEEECSLYCSDPAHTEECLQWGLESGELSPEEVQEMRARMEMESQRRGGPGGCMTEEECAAYCDAHEIECINWAVEQGEMTPEEAQELIEMIEYGRQMEQPEEEWPEEEEREEEPQSFFEKVNHFLANIVALFEF